MQVALQACAVPTLVSHSTRFAEAPSTRHRTQSGTCKRLRGRHMIYMQPQYRAGATVGGYDASSVSPAQPGLQEELRKALDDFISQNKIVLFMKGTQQFPQCGFSNTCVQIFHALDVPSGQFTCVNILEDESLRAGLKDYSMWPTFPQVYIDGEFFGGCDVMIESYQNGELQELVERVLAS